MRQTAKRTEGTGGTGEAALRGPVATFYCMNCIAVAVQTHHQTQRPRSVHTAPSPHSLSPHTSPQTHTPPPPPPPLPPPHHMTSEGAEVTSTERSNKKILLLLRPQVRPQCASPCPCPVRPAGPWYDAMRSETRWSDIFIPMLPNLRGGVPVCARVCVGHLMCAVCHAQQAPEASPGLLYSTYLLQAPTTLCVVRE